MRSHQDLLPHQPKRVLLAGVSGVGKTTLAGRIAAVTGGQHTEIDALFHGPAWTPRPGFPAGVLTDRKHIVRWAIRSRCTYTAAAPRIREYPDLIVARLRSQQEAEAWLSGALAAAVGADAPDEQRKPLACPDDS